MPGGVARQSHSIVLTSLGLRSKRTSLISRTTQPSARVVFVMTRSDGGTRGNSLACPRHMARRARVVLRMSGLRFDGGGVLPNDFWRKVLSRQGGKDTVRNSRRQVFWPLADRRLADANGFCSSSDCSAEQLDGFVLVHGDAV